MVYGLIMLIRLRLYRIGVLPSYRAPVPVVVVGNLTVGGSGKTPLVISLVSSLQEMGLRPGVISRGYGADLSESPIVVNESSDASQVGDEPALIWRRTRVPMVVGPNRQADIQLLLERHDVDLIVCDDGLQHLALQRDFEICIDDRTVETDNKFLLPAGPYREPISRLQNVDCVVAHVQHLSEDMADFASLADGTIDPPTIEMALKPEAPVPLIGQPNRFFDKDQVVHAVAGIGKPQRFFDTCRSLNWKIIEHAFPDHHDYTANDLEFGDTHDVVMTEKDMVKCEAFAQAHHWYLPVNAKLQTDLVTLLVDRLKLSP